MSPISFDFSELNTLAADLGDAPREAGKKIRQAIHVSSRNIKDEWKANLSGSESLPHAGRSITYTVDAVASAAGSQITSEIGAESGRLQAPFVTVIEFGAPSRNLAPRGWGAGALEKFTPDFEKGLGMAIGEVFG